MLKFVFDCVPKGIGSLDACFLSDNDYNTINCYNNINNKNNIRFMLCYVIL